MPFVPDPFPPPESDDPSAVLMRRMVDAFAESERLIIKARTRAALSAKRRRGERTGQVPFGRSLAADGKTLVPAEGELRALDDMRRWRAAVSTLRAIADRLTALGIPRRMAPGDGPLRPFATSSRPTRRPMPRIAGKASRKAPKADPHALSTRLREIVRNRNLTASAIAREADLDPGMVQRFLTGQRDIRLATADAIAAALGLRLVEVGQGRGRPRAVPMAEVPGPGAARPALAQEQRGSREPPPPGGLPEG